MRVVFTVGMDVEGCDAREAARLLRERGLACEHVILSVLSCDTYDIDDVPVLEERMRGLLEGLGCRVRGVSYVAGIEGLIHTTIPPGYSPVASIKVLRLVNDAVKLCLDYLGCREVSLGTGPVEVRCGRDGFMLSIYVGREQGDIPYFTLRAYINVHPPDARLLKDAYTRLHMLLVEHGVI